MKRLTAHGKARKRRSPPRPPLQATFNLPPAKCPRPMPTAAPSWKPRRWSDQLLGSFKVENKSYADEDKDFGSLPVSSLYPVNYHGPTPTTLAGGTLISTYQLHKLLTTESPPQRQNPPKPTRRRKKTTKPRLPALCQPAKPILINVAVGTPNSSRARFG
ncbi:MAG: hypothetical protein U1F68_00605 [Gammaproteobacteria bacterium]